MKTALSLALFCFLSSAVTADTFAFGRNFQQRIPAAGDGHAAMDPVYLTVDDHFIFHNLQVRLDIRHTAVSDLEIVLVAPWGEQALLKEYWVAWREIPQDLRGTIFDDQAPISLTAGAPPFTGTFQSEDGKLGKMAGHDAAGLWELRIYDAIYQNAGALERWDLIFSVPEPGGLFWLAGWYLLRRSRRRSHRRVSSSASVFTPPPMK